MELVFIGLVTALIVYLVFRRSLKMLRAKRELVVNHMRWCEERDRRIFQMGTPHARDIARKLLDDSSKYACVRSELRDKRALERLPDSLRELFGEFESIQAIAWGDLWLRREDLGPYESGECFLKIGTDLEWDVLIKPDEDPIYVFDQITQKPEQWAPTVFHYLVMEGTGKEEVE